MQIVIDIDGLGPIDAELEDSPAARDFASLLPLELTLQDYAATEKVSDLPRRLKNVDASSGYEADAGDLTYYAPWGNLAIFHKSFRYASGLVKLGRMTPDGVNAMKTPGPLKVAIRQIPHDTAFENRIKGGNS